MTTQAAPRARHFLRVSDVSAQELRALLRSARAIKQTPAGQLPQFPGCSVACIFEKPSTRTRLSFAAAAAKLGMAAHAIDADGLQLARGETIGDTARAISLYADLISLRTFEHGRLEEFAAASQVPVINALSNSHHPCQALADLLTIEEKLGELQGRKIAFVGDASSNIAQSLLEAAALSGMSLSIAAPDRYHPDPSLVARARELAEREGAAITIQDDPFAAAENADVVYPEIWVPMDQEVHRARRVTELAAYQVDRRLMSHAKTSAIFLHCLPAFRGEEVTADVLDAPYSAVWQQAANRLPTAQAVLLWLLQQG